MSSPTHASSPIDHYDLLQPPSPRDIPVGTPPSDHLPFQDIEPIDYMSYEETLQWLYDTAGTPAAKGEGPYSDGYYTACRERSSRHLEFQLSREQVLVNLP